MLFYILILEFIINILFYFSQDFILSKILFLSFLIYFPLHFLCNNYSKNNKEKIKFTHKILFIIINLLVFFITTNYNINTILNNFIQSYGVKIIFFEYSLIIYSLCIGLIFTLPSINYFFEKYVENNKKTTRD